MPGSFPTNFWYVGAFVDELGPRLLSRTLLGIPVVLYRTGTGKVVALHDRCPHRGVPLSLGALLGEEIRCTYHGMQIRPDGSCSRIPCQDLIPPQARVRAFPAVERYKLVWLWMGDEASADANSIPDFHWLDDPAWTACTGYHHIDANYQLLNDNLLDLSHESYVHDDTIGNDAVAQAPVTAIVRDGRVLVSREIMNCDPPPFYVRASGFNQKINRWHTTIFHPPSFNVIENGSYPASGSREQAIERRILNLVTPETETSSHYFWGVARAYQRDDESLTAYILESIRHTFSQDKTVLEAQQRSLQAQAAAPFTVALRTDAGPMHARRLIKRLLDGESQTLASKAQQPEHS